MMPSAPTAQCSSAPPVNMLYMPSNAAAALRRALLGNKPPARRHPDPGMRIIAARRQIASTTSVNRIRDFSSGILKQLLKVLVMEASMVSEKVTPSLGSLDRLSRLDAQLRRSRPWPSILAVAEALNAWAHTVSFLVNFAVAENLDARRRGRWPGPALRSAASSTRAPSSNRFKRFHVDGEVAVPYAGRC